MPDTKISALTAGTAGYAQEVAVHDAATSKKLTLRQLETLFGVRKARLSGTQNSTSITPAKVTGLDLGLEVGTYIFEYFLRYRSSIATNGVRFDVNFSGSVTSFVWTQQWVDASAAAATAVPDQDAILATGSVVGGFASRAKGTAGRGTTLSVDTVDLDMFMKIEGLAVVTVTGNLELYFGSEVAGSGTQSLMIDSVLRATRMN